MYNFCYLYEDEYGYECTYDIQAETREEADRIARVECPEAIDAGIEVDVTEIEEEENE